MQHLAAVRMLGNRAVASAAWRPTPSGGAPNPSQATVVLVPRRLPVLDHRVLCG